MKPRNHAAAAATLITATLGTAAMSQGVPVMDRANIAKQIEQVQTGMNQLSQLTDMKGLQEDQLAAIGEFGVLGDLFGSAGFASVGSQAEFYDNMKKFAFDPCSINLCQVGDNPVGTTDIEEAMDWAKSNFYTSRPLSSQDRRDLNEVRRRAVVYATTSGLALANIVHNELAGAGEEASALEEIVDASQNLRGDVRANSAIGLATYKIEVQKLAILSSMLNIAASEAMIRTDIHHEDGGDEFPDAFIDSDFTSGDFSLRTQVTPPEKNAGTPATP